jgi:long-chain acyl-CoA synthetase
MIRHTNHQMTEPSADAESPSGIHGEAAFVTASPARAAARLSKQLERALTEVDLTLPQYRALVFLTSGVITPSVLAGKLAVSRPTITALMDGLVARGLVERRGDTDDRRRVVHQVTPPGHDALTRADEALDTWLSGLAGHLSDKDARQALDGLALWNTALDRSREQRLKSR